ncbi:membrane protein insertase YidC [Reichenbachiella versicolor]|uniref:membrane protein insertase YidC n=1 Tax=Reichenbachiella versicolor TaxID=1821036 RepID=UPI000D6E4B21|nr:membrane protein insertase YidC [Reichenbachiella versicolor]
MDRNQIAGLVVMLILMTVYFQFFAPEPPEPTQEDSTAELIGSSTKPSTTDTSSYSVQDDSLISAINKERYGLLSGFATGENNIVTLENESIIVELSSKGAVVNKVTLKKYKTSSQNPLVLLTPESSKLDLVLASNYKSVNISELYFDNNISGNNVVSGSDSVSVSFKIELETGRYIEQKYVLGGTGYELLYEVNLVGMDGIIDNQDAKLVWNDVLEKVESDIKDSRRKSTINYYMVDNGFDHLSLSEKPEEGSVDGSVTWFSFKQKFFSKGLIYGNGIKNPSFSTSLVESDTSYVKKVKAEFELPIGDLKTGKGDLKYYFGPNNYQITKKVYPGYEENVDLGWRLFRFVNKLLIIPIFNFLDQYISNYGLIIIILVFIIRLLLAPLTWKSHMSMAKMKVLKPEIDAIKERIGDDQQKVQQETMALYSKAGINPLSGCVPMLLQFPFLLAMFNFFPNSIELRQQAFLWAKDLSTYDSILDLPFSIPFYGDHVSLFCLLMTGSTIALTWSNSQMNTQMQGPMKTMQYMMPIMFLFVLNGYSAGLTFYYFISNLVSFGQMSLFRKVIDEEKIKKVMEENRKKNANKKKSGFQRRLDEAMKAAEESKKQQKKKKK